jgi:hypothetical protein
MPSGVFTQPLEDNMKKHLLKLMVSMVVSCFFVTASWAQVCVTLDAESDNLSLAESKATVRLAESGFRATGKKVVKAPCNKAYTISNLRLGHSVTAVISGPLGSRKMKVERIEELTGAYEQMVRALVAGVQLSDSSGKVVTRHNVTLGQTQPRRRIGVDSVYYARLGTFMGRGVPTGEAPMNLVGGYRYELDQIALDFNAALGTSSPAGDNGGGVMTQLNMDVHYFLKGASNHSAFVGGGMGFSAFAMEQKDEMLSGGGLHARVAVGYEFFRASNLRLIVQADATIPLYAMEKDVMGQSGTSTVGGFAPIFGLSIGGGLGRSGNTVGIRRL